MAFATETEEAFARLLTALDIAWEYEPEEFVLEIDDAGKTKTAFRPDFYLPELGFYIELTMQKSHSVKNRKLRLMAEKHPNVRVKLLGRTELALFKGA